MSFKEPSVNADSDLAARLAALRETENKARAFRRRVWAWRAVLLPLLALTAVAGFNLRTGETVGRSMEPLFVDGQRFLIFKQYRYLLPLRIGDVVVVRRSSEQNRARERDSEIVKRVVFIQNETANARLPEVISLSSGRFSFAQAFPFYAQKQERVPANAILVIGDNVNRSSDSRVFGPVFPYELVGKVIFPNTTPSASPVAPRPARRSTTLDP